MDILDFDAEDSFEIKGRGTVYAGRSPVDMITYADTRGHGHEWIGRVVRIHGSLYRIKGVEAFAKRTAPKKGDGIGLLVEPM